MTSARETMTYPPGLMAELEGRFMVNVIGGSQPP